MPTGFRGLGLGVAWRRWARVIRPRGTGSTVGRARWPYLPNWSRFVEVSVDPVAGHVFALQENMEIFFGAGYTTYQVQSRELVEYDQAGTELDRHVIEHWLTPQDTDYLHPVPFVAVNGMVMVAGKTVRYNSSSVATLATSTAAGQTWWYWGETAPGEPPFQVRCVAANATGYVYVGGWSDGAFDGQPLPGSAPGGWFTGFYLPAP
jgi:hypothetical protein